MSDYGKPVFGLIRDPSPLAETCHGKIRGENRNGVAIFRGIPYGGSVSGKRRFLPPVQAANWAGILDCTVNGYYAIQYGSSISGSKEFGPYFSGGRQDLFGVATEMQNEDCLVLNVLSPGLDEAKRPVLVYIHGGGFATGSGTLVLGSDKFVREEDIVLVGINHRLNIFGYLYLGEFSSEYAESGMAGMLDLILALEWVQDNIAAFGGDPSKVTIMGESGGAMKVSTLMAMEKARGLFRYAITESGSRPVGNIGPQDGTAITAALLKRFGFVPKDIDKLLSLPGKELLREIEGSDLLNFGPVADCINLKYETSSVFTVPEISASIPLLVGSSEDELAAFVDPRTLNKTDESLRSDLLNEDKTLSGLVSSGICTEHNVDRVIAVLKKDNAKGNDAAHLYLKAASFQSFLGSGAFRHALEKVENGSAPVYHYLIKYDSPHPYIPGKYFSWHTADLPLQMRIVLHLETEKMSKLMAHSWASFVRTGNPSAGEVEWPRFTAKGRETMIFDDEMRIQKDPMKDLREALTDKG
jgi:para-nitrobenzyl esterase